MILKFILLTTVCLSTPEKGVECNQYIKDHISDAENCETLATALGKAYKSRISEVEGGYLYEYKAQCLAIGPDGLDIDQTFNISYTIL